MSAPPFGAHGDGVRSDTLAIRRALADCNEVLLQAGRTFLSGPLNMTSNRRLRVQGVLQFSQDAADYPVMAPLLGYGWTIDTNCFAPDEGAHEIVPGKLRYAPMIGSYRAANVSVVGSGTIDGRGEPWWTNCTRCHYPPRNESRFCLAAGRPKLLEFQFVDGLRVHGESSGAPLTLKDSPFWTLTPSYSQDIHIHDLRILAPPTRIGNTDGVNLDSCRNAVVEDLFIANGDDGVCMKSGFDVFGLNLAIPTEDVLVRNVTCGPTALCGFALGSDMSGGVRNITYRDSLLAGKRGIMIKPSVGRGGFIDDVLFENIELTHPVADVDFLLTVGDDGAPLVRGNHLVPLVSNLRFVNISGRSSCSFDCAHLNRSTCFNMTFSGAMPRGCTPPARGKPTLRPQRYACKPTVAWGVCLPLDAPVNAYPAYPNWGPTTGRVFDSLGACKASCAGVPPQRPRRGGHADVLLQSVR